MDYTSIKVGQLPTAEISGSDYFPHEVAGLLKKATITDLAAFIGATDAIGFRAVSVPNGGTLPTTDTQEFILVGPGTYNNVGGGSTITVTEELNALVSNGTYWFVGVEIPIDAPPGNAVWGQIIGTLSNQTDLKNILDLKADLVAGKVPSSQLPSYVDDVIEVADYAALPSTGETGKIYITIDTEYIYRWSGSAYIRIVDEAAAWGTITGTLSNQTDLQSELNAKVPTSRTITINGTTYDLSANRSWSITEGVWGQITGTLSNQTDLQSALDGKFDDPTGDTTQYIAGDGSLISFPVAGQAGTVVREVRNVSGATITKGTVVYINGASGNKPTIAKALATSDSTSAQTFGLVQADISNNANGYVVCIGDLIGVNTSGISVGTQLYLSSTTAGEYTTTKQLAPAHLVYIGVVTRSHASLGQIEVKIQNGYELDELHDVAISSKTNNEILAYESSTDLWKNKSVSTILGYTPADDSSVVKLTGDQTIAGIKTFSSTVNAPIFQLAANNTIGSTPNYIGQQMASNDTWKIYGNTIASDQGEMIFELGDNAVPFATPNGQRFRFFYDGLASGTSKSPFILDYNDATFDTNATFSGNVGIGVTPSAWDTVWKVLQISKGSYYASDYSNIIAHNLYVAGEDTKYISSNLASQYEQNSGSHYWYTAPTGTAGANVTLTPRMILDNSGKLGIGIDIPYSALHIKRNASELLRITRGSVSDFSFDLGASNDLYIKNNGVGTTPLTILGSGSVGIGTTSPTDIGGYTALTINNNTSGSFIDLNNSSTNNCRLLSLPGGDVRLISSSQLRFDTNGSERMRITSGGVVSIGIAGSASGQLTLYSTTGSAEGNIYGRTGGGMLFNTNANAYPIEFGGSIIQFNSDVIIGSLTNYNVKLQVAPSVGGSWISGTFSGTGGTDKVVLGNLSGYGGVTIGGHVSALNGWAQININPGGSPVYAGTQRIDNNSDIRIKENIVPIESALDTVLLLQGKKFNMLDEDNILRYGFIAQEVQPHLSDFVTESNRIFEKDDVKIENLLTLESSGAAWAALLVEAIKEQNVMIQELKAELELLKAK